MPSTQTLIGSKMSKLITKEIRKQTPLLYETDGETNPMVTAKFFTPWSNWTWYLIELSENGNDCFGYVCGFEKELGYFALSELESVRGPGGLKIERDMYFKPRYLNEIKKGEK